MNYRIIEKNNGKFNIQEREWMVVFPFWSDLSERQQDQYSSYSYCKVIDYSTFDEAKQKIDRIIKAKEDLKIAKKGKEIKKVHSLKAQKIR